MRLPVPSTRCYQIDPSMLAMMTGGNMLGNLAGGLIGSSAATNASNQAATSQMAGYNQIFNAGQAGAQALSPYYTGGLGDYNFLQYLLGANAPAGGGWTSDQDAALTEAKNRLALYQSATRYSAKNPGALTAAEADVNRLTQAKQTADAGGAGNQMIGASGLPQGYLTDIPKFSYDPATDPSFTGAFGVASDQIAAQHAATGSYGSGNMASALLSESAMLEPEFEQLATNRYNINEVNPRNTLYSYLTGNTGGAGQNVAGNMANLYTGTATAGSPYVTGAGSAISSGTLGSANALTNAITGAGNSANSGMGMYLNNQQQNQLMQMLSQNNNPGGYSTYAYNQSANPWDPANMSMYW